MVESGSPLTPEQRQEVHDATARARSFSGAARVAAFNGWTIGFFAVASILFGLSSLTGLLMGLGLGVVARNEFVGRTRLRSFHLSGLKLLWRNQIGFMALIVAYSAWSMVRTVTRPNPELAQLTELLGPEAGDLFQSLAVSLYAAVIVATVVFQGLNARYYFVRIDRLRDYLKTTPKWILSLQRSGVV